ncbi:YmdB family metallophosphoesterase [Candidatus Peregrinibacteria bacterium]|nr:MAG: YmdB family metallophosphoesterase [Candidatus Peregrinibacteria bacterium]
MIILVIGDITGRPGRTVTAKAIQQLKKEHSIDLVIANGENLAHGTGMTPRTYDELREAGVDFFTSGNHILKKLEVIPLLEAKDVRVLRPLNFPPGNPGQGATVLSVGGKRLLIVNLIGRVFMPQHYDCPFRAIDALLSEYESEPLDGILVDFHAEATSEKIAMKHYLDGRVAALWGTHTHVPTADADVTSQGLAYITDVGMVGPKHSVIGVKADTIIESLLTQTSFKADYEEGECNFNAILLNLTGRTRCETIQPILLTLSSL